MIAFNYSDLDGYRKDKADLSKMIKDRENISESNDMSDVSKEIILKTIDEKISEKSLKLRNFMRLNLTNIGSIVATVVPVFFENSHSDLIDLEKVKKCEFIMLENGEVIQLTQNLMHKITMMSKEYGSKKYFFQGAESKKDFEPLYAYYIEYTDTEE